MSSGTDRITYGPSRPETERKKMPDFTNEKLWTLLENLTELVSRVKSLEIFLNMMIIS